MPPTPSPIFCLAIFIVSLRPRYHHHFHFKGITGLSPLHISSFKSWLKILTDIFFKKKQRRKHSVNRNFYSDYIGMDDKWVAPISSSTALSSLLTTLSLWPFLFTTFSHIRPELRALVGKREKIEFAQTVNEYNRFLLPLLFVLVVFLKFNFF